jgi:hypothetical protein
MSTDDAESDDGLTPAQRAEVKKLVANETEETETTRRDALKMGGGLLGLGLLGSGGLAASSGRAKAVDTSAGQLGTAGSSLDLYIDELKDPGGDNLVDVDDTGSLDWQRAFDVPGLTTASVTDASSGNSYDVDELASGGGGGAFSDEDGDGTFTLPNASDEISVANVSNRSFNGRPMWTTGEVTITVGQDAPTLQDAVQLIPFFPLHGVTIDVPSGTDLSSEDVLIPQTVVGYGTSGPGFEHKVTIQGDTTTPSNCPLGSVVVTGFSGGILSIEGFELQRDNPYEDDNFPAAIEHSAEVRLKDITFAGGTNGVLSYGSSIVELYNIEFGSNVLSGDGLTVKHGGRIQEQRVGDGVNGTVGGHAYTPTIGTITVVRSNSNLTGSSGLVDASTGRAGVVINESDTNQLEYLGGAPYMFDKLGINQNQLYVQGTEPTGASTGDIWIDNDG